MAKKEMMSQQEEFQALVKLFGGDREKAMETLTAETRENLARAGQNMEWLMSYLPSAQELPPDWNIARANWDAGYVEYFHFNGRKEIDLAIIATCTLNTELAGWLHLSISHPSRFPSLEEIALVRFIFGKNSPHVYWNIPPSMSPIKVSGAVEEKDLLLFMVDLYFALNTSGFQV